MNEPLRVGLIGCGRAAERYYLPVLGRRKTGVRLVAAADPRPERVRLALSCAPACRTFDSSETLLQSVAVDAVIVASPPETHVPFTMAALRAGLFVLVEKPLATSSKQVRDLEESISRSSGRVMVGFNQRHWEPVQQLERILRRQNGGNDMSADLSMSADIGAWAPLAGTSTPLEDLGPHLLDLLRFLLQSEIRAVSADESVDGSTELRVELTGGTSARCRVAHGGPTRESIDLRWGRNAYRVRMGSDRIEPAAGLQRSLLDVFDAARRRLRGRRSSLHYSHERQLLRFFDHVRGDSDPAPGVEDGIAVVRAIEAAKRSIADGGREVPV
jgi:predicted dehydrogenase